MSRPRLDPFTELQLLFQQATNYICSFWNSDVFSCPARNNSANSGWPFKDGSPILPISGSLKYSRKSASSKLHQEIETTFLSNLSTLASASSSSPVIAIFLYRPRGALKRIGLRINSPSALRAHEFGRWLSAFLSLFCDPVFTSGRSPFFRSF